MVVHDKFIYLRLEKTGSIFIKDFLKTKFGGQEKLANIGDIGMSGHFGLKEKSDKFTFAGIRNPWDWYVSFWTMLKNSRDDIKKEYFIKGDDFKTFMKYSLTEKTGRGLYFNYDRMIELNIGLLGHEYFRILCVGNNEPYKVNMSEELVDGVYKMENMIPEFIELVTSNGIELTETQKNTLLKANKVNSFKHNHYSDYYDDELIELVRVKEKYIIEKYNYEFKTK